MKRLLSILSILGAVLLLLICTQMMNGGLSLLSFEQQQLATVLSGYDTVGANLSAKLERALRLGKSLENFVGIEELLTEGARAGRDLDNVSVHKASGEVVASLQPAPVPSPPTVVPSEAGAMHSHHLRAGGNHFLLFPVLGGTSQGGFICLAFSEARLQEKRLSILVKSLKVLALCTAVAALLLVFGLKFFANRPVERKRNPFAWLLFIVLACAQLVCSGYNFYLFQNDHLELIRGKSHTVARLLQQDIEALLQKGLQINTLVKIEQQLEATVDRVAELRSLAILDGSGQVLYRGGELAGPGDENPVEYLDLSGRQGPVGRLAIGLNVKVVKEAVRKIAFDSLTIVGLSLLFIMELILFLSATLFKGLVSPVEDQQGRPDLGSLARTAIFLFIFAASLCYSFIPLYMAELYRPWPGLSKELILGLPLALEMLGGGLVLIPVGWWIDKKGWHQPFIIGAFLAMVGTAFSGLTIVPLIFIAARLFAGIGYGMAWMAAQGYVLQRTELRYRARGISNVVAGIFSGIICGNGMGALIAERLGYRQVFLIGAAVMAVGLVFVLLFMRSAFQTPSPAPRTASGRLPLLRLLADPQALLLFACSLLPYSIGMVGLLYYITPIYLKGLATSQSDIGRVIMLFGLCMIFLAPRVSRLADRRQDKRFLVVGGGVLAGVSLLLFHFFGSFWIVPGAVFLFGVSVAISGASRNVVMLALPVAKELGASQVMGVYRSIDKLGQSLGAMVPAALMTFIDMRGAVMVMGGIYLLLTLLLAAGLRHYGDG
jgi:predicted MFS family arabinose efflux permease